MRCDRWEPLDLRARTSARGRADRKHGSARFSAGTSDSGQLLLIRLRAASADHELRPTDHAAFRRYRSQKGAPIRRSLLSFPQAAAPANERPTFRLYGNSTADIL